ncbi:MAG TPA: hypothetical protein VFZ31_11760 [Vicinamibacterales bacterium]
MTDAERALLLELRRLLLQLHKTLIDWQRTEYELDHGRLQTSQLMNVMFNDPAFAWLRSMSGLIVRIDEALDPPSRPQAASARPRRSSPDEERAEAGVKPKKDPIESGPLVAAARELIAPEAGTPYAQRYHAALQELPDAVLAHRDLVTLLKLQRPASNA